MLIYIHRHSNKWFKKLVNISSKIYFNKNTVQNLSIFLSNIKFSQFSSISIGFQVWDIQNGNLFICIIGDDYCHRFHVDKCVSNESSRSHLPCHGCKMAIMGWLKDVEVDPCQVGIVTMLGMENFSQSASINEPVSIVNKRLCQATHLTYSTKILFLSLPWRCRLAIVPLSTVFPVTEKMAWIATSKMSSRSA